MIVKAGEKIHVMTRRKFDTDLRRHFAGEVVDVGENVVRAEGYIFVLDTGLNRYVRRPHKRSRIISLVDAGNIINIIHHKTHCDKLEYKFSEEGRLVLTDDKHTTLDINEFGVSS